jgi:hypothetical protein
MERSITAIGIQQSAAAILKKCPKNETRMYNLCTLNGKELDTKMVKRCCWGTCNSDTRYPETVQNVSFIPFPKPKTNFDACPRWIKACGRLNAKILYVVIISFECTLH